MYPEANLALAYIPMSIARSCKATVKRLFIPQEVWKLLRETYQSMAIVATSVLLKMDVDVYLWMRGIQ